MKCVILQPSFIPWRGYFHQIQIADIFVFYDCVQYDKHGWRNRNKIKTPLGTQWLTIPTSASGSYEGLSIQEVTIAKDNSWRRKHLASIEQNYRKSPYWSQYKPLVESIYANDTEKLADLTCASTIEIARTLGIEHTRFIRSSELNAIGEKTDRLLDVLQKVGADHYISGPSAQEYIESDKFERAGITLEYMYYDYPEYPQQYGAFEGGVSVLDLLFNVGPEAPRYIWDRKHAEINTKIPFVYESL
ncbi:WbqC family protein [Methylotuvimicrobium alcaliphilum]|uniref:WbqC-like family protein n=1 Tax=Methylotuvimicrobium alcaliphilum (strain DSM 19304 / NCIMB 14124 / VKM B-2133 / 20Z) TaxID=1091494 RepID=G4SYW9_META2|nr:WbqC family protein [Methylotuvimicrobium alcaliphilum]CCE24415.1 conserved protein of unknown function [Methylotuvimicrobium alcaliphilum 20Z]